MEIVSRAKRLRSAERANVEALMNRGKSAAVRQFAGRRRHNDVKYPQSTSTRPALLCMPRFSASRGSLMPACHAFSKVPVAIASGAARAGHSIRWVAVLAALSFAVVHGNARAASDIADAAERNDAKAVETLIAAK